MIAGVMHVGDTAANDHLIITSLSVSYTRDLCQNNLVQSLSLLAATASTLFFPFAPNSSKPQKATSFTHSGLQELLPLKWLCLLPAEVKGHKKTTSPNCDSAFIPWKRRRERNESVVAKPRPSHPRPLATENLWIVCALRENRETPQLED